VCWRVVSVGLPWTSTEPTRIQPGCRAGYYEVGSFECECAVGSVLRIAEVRRHPIPRPATGRAALDPCCKRYGIPGGAESIRAPVSWACVRCAGDKHRNQLQHNIPYAYLDKRSQVTFGLITIGHLPVTLGIQLGSQRRKRRMTGKRFRRRSALVPWLPPGLALYLSRTRRVFPLDILISLFPNVALDSRTYSTRARGGESSQLRCGSLQLALYPLDRHLQFQREQTSGGTWG
jgi:hypothetical protein